MIRIFYVLLFLLLGNTILAQNYFRVIYSPDSNISNFSKEVLRDFKLYVITDSDDIELVRVNDSVYTFNPLSGSGKQDSEFVWIRMIRKKECFIVKFPNVLKFKDTFNIHLTFTKESRSILGKGISRLPLAIVLLRLLIN